MRHVPKVIFAAFLLATTISGNARQTPTRQQEMELSATPIGGAAQQDASGTNDDLWHIGILPCLWFAGMHGTTGVLGFSTSVRASPGDLLSHCNTG